MKLDIFLTDRVMIIDLIVDRKCGVAYDAKVFYNEVMSYRYLTPRDSDRITRAMDEGQEQYVRVELCAYILRNGWSEDLCGYIRSVNWL